MHFAALEHSRRDFIRAAGLGSAALLTSGLRPLSAAAYDPADCRLMEFDVSYRTEIASLPRDAKDVQIWMPLPSSDHAQQITGLDIVSPLPYDVTREARFGAKMLHVRAEPHSAPFAVEARYRVTRGQVGIQPGSLPENERSKYLQLTNTVRTTPEIDMFTEEIVGGETDRTRSGVWCSTASARSSSTTAASPAAAPATPRGSCAISAASATTTTRCSWR